MALWITFHLRFVSAAALIHGALMVAGFGLQLLVACKACLAHACAY
jgi:hypothetical protein